MARKAFIGVIVREHCRRKNIIRETDEDLTNAAIQHTNRFFQNQSSIKSRSLRSDRNQTKTVHSDINEDDYV